MSSTPDPPASREHLLRELAEIQDEQARREYLDGHPGLAEPAVVQELCDEVGRMVRVDLDKALSLATSARTLADRVGDDSGRGYSQRVLANVLHRKGDYRGAMVAYEAALNRFARIGDEHQIAITRSSAIHNLIYLGRYEQAYDWADKARAVFEAEGDRTFLARLEFNFANILYRQDRWEEALATYQKAYEEFQALDARPQDIAVCLRTMAVCQISLNDFAAAESSYEKARDVCAAHEMPLLALENEYNIAYLHFLRGEYTRAIHLYQTARRECERLNDEEHLALCDLDLAEIFLELNLVAEAAELGQSAYEKFDRLGMNYEAAKGLTILAIAVSRQGKEFLALELLARARKIFELEKNQVWPAQIDLYQALVYFGEGRFVEAASFANRALAAFTETTFPTKMALCETLLARIELENYRVSEARERCRRALAILAPLVVPALEHQAYFVLGQVEEASGDPEAALAAYRESHVRLERLRSHLQTEELKITFLEDKLVVYENLVSLLLRSEPSKGDLMTALSFIEKAKSRSLADLMAFRAHALPAKTGTRSNLVDQIRSLREELNWYYRQIDLRQMSADERTREQVEALRRESRQREEHLLRTLRELQATDQEFSSLQDASIVDLDSIRAVIPDNSLVLEYYIARGIVYCYLVGRETLEVVPVTVVSRAQELHRLLQFQLSKFLLGDDYVSEFKELVEDATRHHLRLLYNELVAPVANRLDCEHLIIVPHDFLHNVPFQALYDGERHLIDRFSVSFAPSASVYYLCRKKRNVPDGSAVVMGVDDSRTPLISDEVKTVAEVLRTSKLLVNEEANEENLRRMGESCSILHIATHGVFRRDNPMFSAIQLGTSWLSLFDLYSLKLNADLVVLSGCGTGLNVVVGADEIVGLSRGLLYAGAQAVLVTLWDVNDASTASFMRSFYRLLQGGSSPAEALRSATLEVRESYSHPYHWAPFVLVGRPD